MSEWISVKNELPKANEFVLAYLPNYGVCKLVRIDAKDGRKKVSVWQSMSGTSTPEPTHWQPLPAPPKETI